MQALRRHQLAYLRPTAWLEVVARGWDAVARACIEHWAAQGLPLVVTRQPPGIDDDIALGISAPIVWDRRRIALGVAQEDIDRFDDFPHARDMLTRMQPAARIALERVLPGLDALGVRPRVYGSHGWQVLTRMPCVHDASDIDLCIAVADATQADAVLHVLSAAPHAPGESRLDGELVLPDGSAVAWREWAIWRAGGMQGPLLVKRIDGPALEDETALFAAWQRGATTTTSSEPA